MLEGRVPTHQDAMLRSGGHRPLREAGLTPGKKTPRLVHLTRPPWEGLHITKLGISWAILARQLRNVSLTLRLLGPCPAPRLGLLAH